MGVQTSKEILSEFVVIKEHWQIRGSLQYELIDGSA